MEDFSLLKIKKVHSGTSSFVAAHLNGPVPFMVNRLGDICHKYLAVNSLGSHFFFTARTRVER